MERLSDESLESSVAAIVGKGDPGALALIGKDVRQVVPIDEELPGWTVAGRRAADERQMSGR